MIVKENENMKGVWETISGLVVWRIRLVDMYVMCLQDSSLPLFRNQTKRCGQVCDAVKKKSGCCFRTNTEENKGRFSYIDADYLADGRVDA